MMLHVRRFIIASLWMAHVTCGLLQPWQTRHVAFSMANGRPCLRAWGTAPAQCGQACRERESKMRLSRSNSADSDIEQTPAGDLHVAYWRERAAREQVLLRGRDADLWSPGSEPPTDYASKDGNFRLRNGMICARMLYSGGLYVYLLARPFALYCKTAKTHGM